MTTRLDGLINVMNVLTLAKAGNYYREIGEVWAEIKTELAIGEEGERGAKSIPQYTTSELHSELVRREGVEEYLINAYEGRATLVIDNGNEGGCTVVDGPARILVNRD